MNPAAGKRLIITSAMIVAGLRLWMQVRGKTKTPFTEWAVGWGALFLLLSLGSEVAPSGAGMLSLLVVVGDVLANGSSLLTDVSGLVTGAEKGQPVLTAAPFAGTPSTTAGSSQSGTSLADAVNSANRKATSTA